MEKVNDAVATPEAGEEAAASCAATVDGASAAATCAEEVNAAAATPTVGAADAITRAAKHDLAAATSKADADYATPPVLTAAAATGAEESTLELIGNTNVPVVLNGALNGLNKAQCDSWRSPWRLGNN